jgi:phosphate transport system permease protein
VGRNAWHTGEGELTMATNAIIPDSLPPRPPMDFTSRRMRLNDQRRKVTNWLVSGLAVLATCLVVAPLLLILGYLIYKGASSLNVNFFTKVPAPVGETGGGMANSIVGSGIVLLLSSLMGIPIGIAAGVYLAEYGRGKFLGNAVRFTADVLNGVPSIVMGIAIYSLIVMPQHHFSAFAGGVALAIMMVPTVTRTTEEMLATVPHATREAALGLGVPKWRTTISVALRTASPGIITGCMLAFARVAGETAPLLFTAFGNQFWSVNLNQPIAALPLQIYTYAISPYDEWHRLAWAGSLVLIAMIMVAVTLVRIYASRGMLKGGN